jgi:hypothetical protein
MTQRRHILYIQVLGHGSVSYKNEIIVTFYALKCQGQIVFLFILTVRIYKIMFSKNTA